MSDTRPLVVGAGPAGLRAAITLAEAGQPCVLVDHAPGIGGAVHADLRAVGGPQKRTREALKLLTDFERARARIDLRLSTSLAALDHTGTALLTGAGGMVCSPQAVILATGARELVRPRPGITLPGVTTAGALQIGLKTAGLSPRGRTLIAGSGPLLYAIAAQLTRAGAPPVAVLEAGRPATRAHLVARLPARLVLEACSYMAVLCRAGVPLLFGTELHSVEARDGKIVARTSRNDKWAEIEADHIGLHDGLARNDYGFSSGDRQAIPVVQAGDCRQVLGKWAAEEDGYRAALTVLDRTGLAHTRSKVSPAHFKAKQTLDRIFANPGDDALHTLPDDTVLCRCENKRLGELRAFVSGSEIEPSARSIRLALRTGMGPCQGRQCLDWVARLTPGHVTDTDLRGARWPLKPVTIGDILCAPDHSARPHPQETEA